MATAKKATKKTAPTVSKAAGIETTNNGELKRLKPTEFIETGNVGLDIALSNGKGIPKGANIMLYGLPGTGKTTILGDVIKRLMDKYRNAGIPLRIHYVDSESSRELLESTGVMEYVYEKEEFAPQQVIYHEHVNSFKYLEELYTRVLNPQDNWGRYVQIIIIDSVTKLLAETQLTNAVDKADFGENAKARKKLYGKWLSVLQDAGLTQFWVSQVSTKQGASTFEDPKKPAVSDFDRHNMDIILKLIPNKDVKLLDVQKIEVKTIQGTKKDLIKYIVSIDPGQSQYVKNRIGQNNIVDILLWRGHGVINAFILRDMLMAHKFARRDNNTSYSINQELADYLGGEALEAAGISSIDKMNRATLNKLCSMNNGKLIQFFKERNMYKLETEEVDETSDGLF